MKKLLSLALCAVLLHMNAAALPAMGELTAKSAALYDASGQMLYEMNAEESLQPASVTKIMTLLLAMEALDRGEVQLDTMVTGSAHAASMGGTQIWLKEGEQLPFDEMLKAIAVGSANDCAVAVAEHLYGSEEAFVQKMNERAKELGCTSTTFVNANGSGCRRPENTYLGTRSGAHLGRTAAASQNPRLYDHLDGYYPKRGIIARQHQ